MCGQVLLLQRLLQASDGASGASGGVFYHLRDPHAEVLV